MPCYDSRNDPQARYDSGVLDARREFRHNSDVAELLCAVLRDHIPADRFGQLPKPVIDWWNEHQKRDRERTQNQS